MARLVDDLLDMTRISRGKLRLRRARLELGELVRRTLDDHRALLAERRISAALGERDLPLWIDADATRLAQVVGNLLQNAAKFANPDGHVEVTVERSGADATVRVRDDGIGFAGELLPALFRPFSQAERTLERTRGGLGLGLALSRALVEMHGGAIEARSDGPGRGAEFALRLPLVEPRGNAEPPRGAAAAPEAPRRVLVVDDNVDGATTLAELLRLRGHEVSVAHDGRAGLDAARRLAPDVILCDLGLPLLNGYDLARAVRADGDPRPVLVALTGYATAHDTARSADAGFDAHVVKPPDVDRLFALVAGSPRRTRG
jgi:CheY-like chemotaxis protein/two-component sensor histidine kinase